MKRAYSLLLFLVLLSVASRAQAQNKYLTKTGQISFSSSAPIEDIEANNQQVAAVFDVGTGQLAFVAPIKGFVFKRTLMQEHFNENYLSRTNFRRPPSQGAFWGWMPLRWPLLARTPCRWRATSPFTA